MTDAWLDDLVGVVAEHFGVVVVGVEQLTGGYLNQTWRLRGLDHDRVLRIGRRTRSVGQVRYERQAAIAWSRVVPQVVVAESADVPVVDGRTLSVFPFVEGRPGTTIAAGPRSRTIAGVMAALHRSSVELGLPQRPGFTALDEVPPWPTWRTARRLLAARHPDDAVVTRAVAVVDAELDRLEGLIADWADEGRLALRATVHGDLNPRNQLYRDGELVAVIDTDDCRVEPLVWEVAQAAYGDPTVDPDDVWRWYRDAGGPVPEGDRELLAPMARIGAMSELQWLLDDDDLTPQHRDQLLEIAGWVGAPIARDAP